MPVLLTLFTISSGWAAPDTTTGLDPEALRAKDELGLEPEFAQAIREGLELLYRRQYEQSRAHFVEMETRWPGTGLAPVGDILVWQALMMENFDYRFDKQYWVSSKSARKELEAAMKVEGNDAWEHFLMAGVAGVEAIHTMRQSRYLKALSLAFEAMDNIEKTREGAPGFTDLMLADGMYNYWRTVVTQSSSVLPDFGDHKKEGIDQMLQVESKGLFLAGPATLSLAFAWIEEKDNVKALASCQSMKQQYPDNVINNLVLGSVQVSMRKYNAALASFDKILADSPKNKRARYWRALSLQRAGRLDEAMADYRTYLGFDYMEDYQRSQAHYRLAQCHEKKKAYPRAEAQFKKAVQIDGHKNAKKNLERLRGLKKEGKIDY